MRILAIETSTLLGGIAIMDDISGLIAETRLNVKSTHSERLMTSIDNLLKQSSTNLGDIEALAISIGPGSFTGLRIGLSTVKGLSYATGKPIVSVPTLEAFALSFFLAEYPICIMLDARKREVYAALFKWKDSELIRLVEELSIKPRDLMKKIEGKVIFSGEGALLYRDIIIESLDERAIFALPEKMVPSPANVASIGLRKALKGEFADPISLVPFYIRKSEAELKKIPLAESFGNGR
ncbi:MAG: tRNA (adenosine(37)-N6)-threonylcarbamoyltransferase complex dimerization subunit type 1 TsaB [Nitrospirota bacterium]